MSSILAFLLIALILFNVQFDLSEKNFKREDWVLTPHPGEAARLLSKSSVEIQENRFLSLDKLPPFPRTIKYCMMFSNEGFSKL